MLPEKVFPEKSVRTNSPEEVREWLATDFQVTYATANLTDIEISPEGTVCWNEDSLPFTRFFLESLAGLIGMPLGYADKIDFLLFRHNFEQRKAKESCAVMICISRETAINVCRAAYYPARTIDILDKGQEQLVNKKLHEAAISDRGVELSWIYENDPIDPKPGDTIFHGLRISNSETGGRRLKASLYTLRPSCANGAVMNDEWGAARWTYDRRVTYKANVAHFFQDLKSIETKVPKLPDVYQELIQKTLTDIDFVRLW